MEKRTDIIFQKEEKQDVEKITELIRKMNDTEKTKMIIFMQGVKFAQEKIICT